MNQSCIDNIRKGDTIVKKLDSGDVARYVALTDPARSDNTYRLGELHIMSKSFYVKGTIRCYLDRKVQRIIKAPR